MKFERSGSRIRIRDPDPFFLNRGSGSGSGLKLTGSETLQITDSDKRERQTYMTYIQTQKQIKRESKIPNIKLYLLVYLRRLAPGDISDISEALFVDERPGFPNDQIDTAISGAVLQIKKDVVLNPARQKLKVSFDPAK